MDPSTVKTVPLPWPDALKDKLRPRAPYILLLSPHGTGLGGEGFTRIYLPLPPQPPEDLMTLPCMYAYLPFEWQDPNTPPKLQDDKKMMQAVVKEGERVEVTHYLAIRGNPAPIFHIKPKDEDRPDRVAGADAAARELEEDSLDDGATDEGSASASQTSTALSATDRKRAKLSDGRSVASWCVRIYLGPYWPCAAPPPMMPRHRRPPPDIPLHHIPTPHTPCLLFTTQVQASGRVTAATPLPLALSLTWLPPSRQVQASGRVTAA